MHMWAWQIFPAVFNAILSFVCLHLIFSVFDYIFTSVVCFSVGSWLIVFCLAVMYSKCIYITFFFWFRAHLQFLCLLVTGFLEMPVRFSVPLDVFLAGAVSELDKERHSSLVLSWFVDCGCSDPSWERGTVY